jgi:hypothetical protein
MCVSVTLCRACCLTLGRIKKRVPNERLTQGLVLYDPSITCYTTLRRYVNELLNLLSISFSKQPLARRIHSCPGRFCSSIVRIELMQIRLKLPYQIGLPFEPPPPLGTAELLRHGPRPKAVLVDAWAQRALWSKRR